jgi:hypothetical protein
MNDTDPLSANTTLVESSPPVVEHDYVYVVPYTSARQLILALSFVGFGLVIGMTAVVLVMTILITRLNRVVTRLRKQIGDDVRDSLVQKTMVTKPRENGTSCADDEHEEL